MARSNRARANSGWHTGPHSDPHGLTLKEIRRYLRSEPSTAGCALFWDIASRPQPEQTRDEAEIGVRALEVMSSFYASITGTAVLQQKTVPSRPAMYDGGVQLFGIKEELRTAEALTEDMRQFGAVVSCEILPSLVDLRAGVAERQVETVHAANAIVRFATHAEAEAAVAGLKAQKRGATFLYNDTPYEGVGGRGWCLVEQGSSMVVAAHLTKASAQGTLPAQFARAVASRPKVIDLSDGKSEVRDAEETDPTALLERTMRGLHAARFTFPSDKEMAIAMMEDFEFTIKMAMEQAEIALNAHDLSFDPQVIGPSLQRRTSWLERRASRADLQPPAEMAVVNVEMPERL